MSENLQLAVQLLMVGMTTVFVILTIVVGLGRVVISLVNKFSKAPAPKAYTRRKSSQDGFSKKKLAALTSVVDIVTQGQGVIKSVKKIQ